MTRKLNFQEITLPVTDGLIAMLAKRHLVPVLTINTHFDHLSVIVINLAIDKHHKL
ncbi:MAG: hypothetical protein HOE45_02215 [Gammaproteobacteria bacterium]|jgi:hypothetical protein|uniref:hypothetical protein n=1 Tax=Methyloprofundus sp. TaxID=2020875 RepID=UPI001DF6E9DF|nr:hypothetical protein [Methyloprofundus sp.]MBT4145692.1 hypothetical protein [Gammaproteobacteria bacterium]